ncbi:lipid kinase YegS [Halomonas vilamensis]|uniref:Lipid kinase YegS n=1 Tax=Vreelandella vilamensis TaxID=531309 RepID=A0ABU1H2Z6_9GAMM|nr:lipid kinase YegS [Halomonas vilamensis]MDR5898127.1 lipid kinase YegS [Halomonas vilamensis]
MNDVAPRYCLVVNGKSSNNPALRDAVTKQRQAGMALTVLVTWEAGDAADFAERAAIDGFTHVIAGGGDGTVNEVVNGMMRRPKAKRPVLGIVPLGSANDFATSIGVPVAPNAALKAVCKWKGQCVDVVRISTAGANAQYDEQYYINMTTGGFGAEITSSTPKRLKRLFGGGAYSVMGALKAWRHSSYHGTLDWGEGEQQASLLLLALGNARQAGGGQVLAPKAKLNDGYIDVLLVKDFSSIRALSQLLEELRQFPREGQFVRYFTATQVRVTTRSGDPAWPLTLDGESRCLNAFTAEVEPLAITVAMPADSPLLVSPNPEAKGGHETMQVNTVTRNIA